jgi:hypothetical protein
LAFTVAAETGDLSRLPEWERESPLKRFFKDSSTQDDVQSQEATMSKAFNALTRPVMRRLQPGDKLTENGITFERLANGDGLFTVNIMVDGQRIHRVIGRESDGTTRTQAEDFIGKVREDAREDRLSLPKGRKIALTFSEAALKYLSKLDEEGARIW